MIMTEFDVLDELETVNFVSVSFNNKTMVDFTLHYHTKTINKIKLMYGINTVDDFAIHASSHSCEDIHEIVYDKALFIIGRDYYLTFQQANELIEIFNEEFSVIFLILQDADKCIKTAIQCDYSDSKMQLLAQRLGEK